MANEYKDTEHRMIHDVSFRAAVMMLANLAREHGFTPGELKQIAFRAALEIELNDARPMMFRRGPR